MSKIYRTALFKRVKNTLVIVLASILNLYAIHVFAEATGPGDIVPDDGTTVSCMQEIAGFDLNCTANDVRVSGVADVTGDGIVDENDITFAQKCDATASNAGADCSSDSNICLDGDGNPDSDLCGDKCAYPGDTTTFSATFIFELSAQERYDVGAYFEVKPDEAEDGALTGACQIVTLPEDETQFTRPDGTMGNYVDLDSTCKGGGCPQPKDLCGDIDNDNNPVYYDMRGNKTQADLITATCSDPDNDGKLNLPNCTSWRQSGANEVCFDGLDAFPGSPSKCNCDPNFQVPIDVPAATITVDKSASPTSVDENKDGKPVTYTVKVTNNSLFADVTINTLLDDMFGDITFVHAPITSTDCLVPQVIAPGVTYPCTFTATISGQGGDEHTNTVTASGEDENGNLMEDSDDATVAINDVPFDFSVNKTADPEFRFEPGGLFTFTVEVTNTSPADEITVTSIIDSVYGDLNGQGNCSVPQTLLIGDGVSESTPDDGDTYTCSFTVEEIHQPPWDETDVVKVYANDEETDKDTVFRTADATIQINDVDSSISVTKTAAPTTFNEPSGVITYDIDVTNTSSTDVVYINSLNDTILGDVTTPGHDGITNTTCSVSQTLLVGETYSCEVEVKHEVNGDGSITNTVTAEGEDDDGEAVKGSDSETVTYKDVLPTATLVKEVAWMDVKYTVKVMNTSTAEALTLDSLNDDRFGDITKVEGKVQETNCQTGDTVVIPKADPILDPDNLNNTYTCYFIGRVTSQDHTNEVTGTVSDNDGNSTSPSDTATVSFKN